MKKNFTLLSFLLVLFLLSAATQANSQVVSKPLKTQTTSVSDTIKNRAFDIDTDYANDSIMVIVPSENEVVCVAGDYEFIIMNDTLLYEIRMDYIDGNVYIKGYTSEGSRVQKWIQITSIDIENPDCLYIPLLGKATQRVCAYLNNAVSDTKPANPYTTGGVVTIHVKKSSIGDPVK